MRTDTLGRSIITKITVHVIQLYLIIASTTKNGLTKKLDNIDL